MSRTPEAGVILVNVLVILSLAAGIVVLMLTSQDRSLARARLMANAAQAEALALGAEASVVVALRRDLSQAPEADHLAEAWAESLQEEVVLDTGRFAVAVRDANARFDVNRLTDRQVGDMRAFARMAGHAGLTRERAMRVAAVIVAGGPLDTLSDLERRGIAPQEVAALATVADALPVRGAVNLNTAQQPVMAALLANDAAAARLTRLRARTGALTPADLEDAGVLRPPATGFISDVWDVSITAEVDGAVARLESRIVRDRSMGRRDVFVARRRWMTASDTPPPPEGLG